MAKVKERVGFLRQWINEKPKDMMVTNEQIETWLFDVKDKEALIKPNIVAYCAQCGKVLKSGEVVCSSCNPEPKPKKIKKLKKAKRHYHESLQETFDCVSERTKRLDNKLNEVIDRLNSLI